MAVMSLMDQEGASTRGSDCDQLTFPYQYPIPHPYSSPHPLHQLPALGGGGGPCSEGNKRARVQTLAVGSDWLLLISWLLLSKYGRCEMTDIMMSEVMMVCCDLTGSCSSGSNCSDNQEEGAGGSELRASKQEASASPEKRLEAEPLSDSRVQRPLSCFEDLLPSSRGQHHDLPTAQPGVSASRQSFRMAMGNPGDFFVDVM